MEWQDMLRENLSLRQALAQKESAPPLIGSTSVMKELFERIKQVAPTMATLRDSCQPGSNRAINSNRKRPGPV